MNEQEEFVSRKYPIEEDMDEQRRAWRFERIGIGALVVLIGLTLGGLFSKGPLSHVQLQTPDGRLSVEYERFSRNGAQDDVIVSSSGAPGEMRYLVLGHEWLEGMSIESLNPQPANLTSDERDLMIPMRADARGTATLYLSLRSNGVGLYRGHIRLKDGPQLDLPKFIYP
ncbi:hypothetical protein TRP66_21475 [Pseudomonas sp. JDS28PS106]|uniref:hypothetical protein n=1 Tax=Pseudomonas sp. JDS28PS106 TaxID=2497235 RepID=UPI002FD5E6FF